MITLFIILLIIGAYLIGSLTPSIWISRYYFKTEITAVGSGNPGATNVSRILGYKTGLLILFLDTLKGWVAVQLASLMPLVFEYHNIDLLKALLGFVVILGHVFPVYNKFKGGKGVATTTGALIAVNPILFLSALAVFVVVFVISKYISLSSVLAAFSVPFALLILEKNPPTPTLIFVIIIAIGIPLTHLQNIKRLIKKQESAFRFSKK